MEKLEQERNSVLHTLTNAESTERGISAFYFNTCCKKNIILYILHKRVRRNNIIYSKNAFSIASLFCNSIMFMLGMSSTCMFLNLGLLVGCWSSLALHLSFRTKIKGPKPWGSPPASASQTRTSTLHVCPFHIRLQRSLCLNLNQKDMTAIPQVQMRTSQTGKDSVWDHFSGEAQRWTG